MFFQKGKDEKNKKRLVKKYLKEVKKSNTQFSQKKDILLRKKRKPNRFFKNCIEFSIYKTTIRSSEEERRVDALALGAEEGRDKLR